jgi:multiple sugar transport system ATP-binding protein
MNFLEGTLERDGGTVRFRCQDLILSLPDDIGRAVRDQVGKRVYLGIRPENIHDATLGAGADPGNIKTFHADVVEPLGAETLVYLRGPARGLDVVARFDTRSSPRVNQDVQVAFDMNKAHVFDHQTEESLTYAARYDAGLPA